MKHEEREKHIKKIEEDSKRIRETKGKDYSLNSDDANRNFKKAAEEMDFIMKCRLFNKIKKDGPLTEKKLKEWKEPLFDKHCALRVYLKKHDDAYISFLANQNLEGEGIAEKILDQITYYKIDYTQFIEDGIIDISRKK